MADKPSVIRETDDEARGLARALLRSASYAALSVLEPGTGFPFVSRTLVATATDCAPAILVSALSTHTKALRADGRASLLAGEPGKGDPLAHPRVTVQCIAEPVERDSPAHATLRRRFLARHPKAALYIDFPDFSFFRLVPQRASLNGGFGRAYLLEGSEFLIDPSVAGRLEEHEQGLLDTINAEWPDAIAKLAAIKGRSPAKGSCRLVGIDAAGIDIKNGDTIVRKEFARVADDLENMRALLNELNIPLLQN
ncbi:HugZ family pyridoxamine 5'-phosphate oxidase [Rhizobium sp. PAMB 3182]